MATQEELKLAAKLVLSGFASREQIEDCLRVRDERERQGKPVELAAVLLERGLVSKAEVDSMLGVPLTETQPIPDYRFERRIAEGGMAEVYLATYLPLRNQVALKIMKPELARNEAYRLRFLRESKLLMNLEHANIVRGYEIRRAEGYIFCAMEHVDGATVEDRIEETGPFDEKLALYVTREVAHALSYLDRRGVVHRDIKPGNILLTEQGAVKIIDLGLAKLRGGMTRDAAEGTTVGTVEYLSPEQARGLADVDIRSDIYSLGVTLFHMVVGEVPFKGESNAEVIAKQVLMTLASPALKSRRISAHTHYFVQRMMAKDRNDRFQHPDELIADIEEKVGPLAPAAAPVTLEPVYPPRRSEPSRGDRRPRGDGRGRRRPGRGRRR
ncbi:MAG: serine/threonine protein kinase [Planctomycetes bacterium]|nr:serine/threonine protein kinase [Planctomycetota bacterium]